MISNMNTCYRRYLSPNVNFYIELRNQCTKYINAMLSYRINDKKVSKYTPVVGPGKMHRIVFPGDATNLFLRVFNSSKNPPGIIFSRSAESDTSSCYKIIDRAQGGLECIKIEC